MAFDSYRDFIEKLEAMGELIRVSEPVATELEITEWADREMKKTGGGKALLFENPTVGGRISPCLLYTSPSPRDRQKSRMPSSA